jgi:hypothetical protein
MEHLIAQPGRPSTPQPIPLLFGAEQGGDREHTLTFTFMTLVAKYVQHGHSQRDIPLSAISFE